MTCEVCCPKAFRPSPKSRVFGYVVFRSREIACHLPVVPDLHYMGAETVFTDFASGRVRHRPGFKLLRKILRAGDLLLIDRETSLGTKPGYRARNYAELDAMGVELAVLSPSALGMRLAA